MTIPTDYLLALSGILFILGAIGVLTRRNTIVIFMSIELMLNSANLAFISFARAFEALEGTRRALRAGAVLRAPRLVHA